MKSQLLLPSLLPGNFAGADLDSLNETALGQVENVKNQFKNKCDKNGGPDVYDKVLKANDEIQNCIKGLVNMTELQDEIEKAKPTGDLDIVFKKYCMKKPTLKKCITDFTSTLEPCLETQERDTVKIALNVTDSLLNFICHKEGDRIACKCFLFLSNDNYQLFIILSYLLLIMIGFYCSIYCRWWSGML